jgi:adenosylmethionine-8-amino-7-oxononanoate aminotransferase
MTPIAAAAPRRTPLRGAELTAYDREHLWHPYTSATDPAPARTVLSARGVRLRLDDGREVVDAMSSWWCAIHGYANPVLDAAVRDQLHDMAHVMFGGLTHSPAVELARRLLDLAPDGLAHVFFADSGSVAVEVALKIAVQHQRGVGHPDRSRVLSLRGGYHGDTAGAMSVCDPVGGMHAMFADVLRAQLFAPRPPAGLDADVHSWAQQVSDLVEQHADELAAVVCEPVLQGAGGMHVYPPAAVRHLRQLADRHGLLLIADEIATGFGRTGTMFACERAGVTPDVLCVGKALTGGYVSLAAVLVTPRVAQGVSASESGVLMHGPTFMANPLACAVAAASLDLLVEEDWAGSVARISSGLQARLHRLAELPGVAEVRTLGAVGVVQLDQPVDVAAATAAALDAGVWVRPFRDLVYTMPPYVCTDDEIATIAGGVGAAVRASLG